MRRGGTRLAATLVAMALTLCAAHAAHADDVLAAKDVRIVGVGLQVSPATQTAPVHQATGLYTYLVDPANLTTILTPSSSQGLVVKGELSGPGVATETVSGEAGKLLPIRALPMTGNYTVDNLRLEDAAGNFILWATPAVAQIQVIDRVIVSSVSSRPLSLEEIRARGIVIDESNFNAFEFTVGFETQSGQVLIPFDLAFPQDQDPQAPGGLTLPKLVPSLLAPNLEVQGLILQQPPFGFEDVEIPPIPAVIVIPGNIAFLDQFFQVLVLVSNVAPPGTELVVTSVTASLPLPVGADLTFGTTDDPLSAASVPGQAPPDPSSGLMSTPVLRVETGDGSRVTGGEEESFGPGEQGQGEFVLVGEQEGAHHIEITIEAELRGLPVGPVPLTGKAIGTVLVRNPDFALSFNHPNVVRAGERYSLFVTVHNISTAAAANLVSLALDPKHVIGATLVGDSDPTTAVGTVAIDTIGANDAATVEFELIARKNGRVTATGFVAESAASGQGPRASFVLRTGIGDAGIPLSPETLVLPSYVEDLPPEFFNTAMRVLGLAHSVATAPPGAPIGITNPVGADRVASRAQDLAEAGLRLRIRSAESCVMGHASCVAPEAVVQELHELMLDWLGNQWPAASGQWPAGGYDSGFDEVLRKTQAGHDLESALAEEIVRAGGTLFARQEALATAAVYRGGFVSIVATGDAQIRLRDETGAETAGCAGTVAAEGAAACPDRVADTTRAIPATALLGFADGGELTGEWALVGRTEKQQGTQTITKSFTLELTGSGTSDVQIVVPGEAAPSTGSGLRRFRFTGVSLSSTALTTTIPGLLADGASITLGGPASAEGVYDRSAGPQVVGVRQIPEADPLQRGRTVAVLFSEAIDPASIDPSTGEHFTLFYPAEAGAQPVRTQNRVKRLKLLPKQRIVLLNFFSSVSRFFDYELTVSGVADPDGSPLAPKPGTSNQEPGTSGPWAVVRDFETPLGGVVSGTVRNGLGEPIPFAPVELRERFLDDITGLAIEILTGEVLSDATGFYRFDFVAQNDLGAFRVRAEDPTTDQAAQRFAEIRLEGERRQIDLIMLGLGRVTGTVWDATTGLRVPGARVTITSHTDGSTIGTTADANGAFVAPRVAVGNLLVSAADAAGSRRGSVAATLETAGATATADVLLFAGSGQVEGTVYEAVASGQWPADGETLRPVGAGVRVVLADAEEEDPRFVFETRTDSSGHFAFLQVPAATVVVRALRDDTAEQVTVAADVVVGQLTAVNLILPGTATVVGTVRRADGSPAAGVSVVGGTSLVTTDADGSFVIARVQPGHHVIEAADLATGETGEAEVDITAAGTSVPVAIVLAGRGTIGGYVYSATNSIIRNAPVFLWFGGAGYLRTTTDHTGYYRFAGLPLRTDYVVRSSNSDGDGAAEPAALVLHGQVLSVNLRYGGRGTVTGVILSRNPDQSLSATNANVRLTYTRFNAYGLPETVTTTLLEQQLGFVDDFPTEQQCGTDLCGDGTNSCTGRFVFSVPPGFDYRVEVASPFQGGDPAALTGRLDDAADIDAHCVVLGESGRIEGTVFLPDGSRVAGRELEVTYFDTKNRSAAPRPDVTNTEGEFVFTVVPLRPFMIAARDPATGNRGVARGSVVTGDTTIADVHLLGQGTVTVRVVDGSGNRMAGARVTLTSGSPVAFLLPPFPVLVTSPPSGEDPGGEAVFTGVPEGEFSVSVEHAGSLSGGSNGGVIVEDHGEVVVEVRLGAAGSVTGTVFDDTGTTAVPFAQIRLIPSSGASLYETAGADGAYRFAFVPLGAFSLEVFDARTGRIGFDAAQIDYATETVEVDPRLLALGRVQGTVERPSGTVVAGAQVTLSSALLAESAGLEHDDVSFFGMGTLTTTTNLEGTYAFDGVPAPRVDQVPLGDARGAIALAASDPETGAMGTGATRLTPEAPTATVTLTLSGRGRVTGRVLMADGVTPLPYASVTYAAAGTSLAAQSDANGAYLFPSVPLGSFSVTAKEQGGNDGGRANGAVGADGEEATVDITCIGTGTIRGTVVDGNGAAVQDQVALTLERRDPVPGGPGTAVPTVYELFSGTDGTFELFDVPAGSFTITATYGLLAGVSTGVIASDGEVVDNVLIELEDAGSVAGVVYLSDGVTAANQAVVALSGSGFTRYTETNTSGQYAFSNVPQGPVTIRASLGAGVNEITGVPIDAQSPTTAAPIVLDDSVAAVTGVTPADGAARVGLAGTVTVTFSEAVVQGTVTLQTFIVRVGNAAVSGSITWPQPTVATFTPDASWPEFSTVSVEVNRGVTDAFGRPLAAVFRSSFQTADVTAPVVTQAGLVQGWVVVQWSEAVDTVAPGVIRVRQGAQTTDLAGTIAFGNGNRTITFKPWPPLADEADFTLYVEGWSDVYGVAQAAFPPLAFSTADDDGPIIALAASANPAIAGETVTITALPASDDVLYVDFLAANGQIVGTDNTPLLRPDSGQAFTHAFVPAIAGATVTVTAVATDFTGNRGPATSLDVAVVANQAPVVAIAAPASAGTGQTFTVTATASDDVGLDAVELHLDGTYLDLTEIYRFAPGVRGPATATFAIPIPAAARADVLVLSVVARDVRGVLSVADADDTATVPLADRTRPVAAITSLAGNFVVDPGQTIPVAVAATDNEGVAQIRLRAVGANFDQTVVAPVPLPYTFNPTIPTDAPDGEPITLIAEAADAAGNVGEAPRYVLTVRDVTPPAVSLTAPANGSQQIAGSAVSVLATATDSNGTVSEVRFFRDGVVVAVDRTATGTQYSATVLMPTAEAGMSVGLGAQAVDQAGNASATATITVTLRDNVPPTANAGGDQTISVGDRVTVSGQASSDLDGQPLSYRWAITAKPAGSTAVLSGANQREAWFTPDATGVYTLELIVNDGIVDSTADTVDVTAVVPSPTFTATSTNTPTDTATPTVTRTPTPTATAYPTFAYRQRIDLDGGACGAACQPTSAVTGLPVLVRLECGVDLYCDQLQPDCDDIAFVDEDEVSFLAFEQVGTCTTAPGQANYFYVRKPIMPASPSTTFFYALHGHPTVPDSRDAAAVWGEFAAVYHLDGAPVVHSASVADSTANGNTGIPRSTGVTSTGGKVVKALSFSGASGTYVDLGNGPSVRITGESISFGCWFNVTQTQPSEWDRIFVKPYSVDTAPWNAYALHQRPDLPQMSLYAVTTNGGQFQQRGGPTVATLTANTWTHAAYVLDGATDTATLLWNGAVDRTITGATGTVIDTTQSLVMGGNPVGNREWYAGKLDECWVSAEPFNPEFVRALYNAQRSDCAGTESCLLSFGLPVDALGNTPTPSPAPTPTPTP